MSIKDTLIANEEIVFESEKHWIAPVRDSVIPVLLLIAAYFVGWLSPDNQGGVFGAVGNLMDLIRTGLVVVALAWIVYNIILWRTATFAVTNLRVIREEGLISRRSSATLLGNVTDVKTAVPFVGARLGYGDIAIYTQSGDAGADQVHHDHPTDRVPRQDPGQEDGRRRAHATARARFGARSGAFHHGSRGHR